MSTTHKNIAGFIIIICLLLLSRQSHAQATYCLQSADGKKLNMRLTLIDKDWQYGYVKYNMPEYGIVIKQQYSHTLPSFNRPGLTEYLWNELRGDTITGTYQLMRQGDTLTDIIYTRSKDKQLFKFTNTNTGLKDCECVW